VTREELLTEFRRQVEDQAEPYLWSDDEALRYLVDAQDTLVRHTGGIADETVAAADVGDPATRLQDLALTAGEPFSAISEYVLRVRNARLLTANRDVSIANLADLQQVTRVDYGVTVGYRLNDEQGDVQYGLTDVRDGQVRWVKVPADADTCRLVVFRLPFPRMTIDNDVELEIAGHHHLHLVKWMKHLAYSKEDAETYDKQLADRSKAAFAEYCEQARVEQDRRRFKPRVVHYGGL